MAKDSSAQSSAVGSGHPSPQENGHADEKIVAPGPQQQQVHIDSANEVSPTPMIEDSNNPTDAKLVDVRSAESQPMTASTSTSSNISSKDAAGGLLDSAIPYGTRSRNRNGGSRPNYAETKDIDVDFDVAASGKTKNGRKSAAHAHESTTGADSGRHSGNTRKSAVPESELNTTTRSHSKEPIPGTSTFPSKPVAMATASQPSKKRKAVGQPTSSTPQYHMQGAPQSAPRGSNIPQICLGFRETNMLTFDDCGGRLQGERLVADDGTVLEVNDHVYLVCEPPGEPYYLGRIMEFLHLQNDSTQPIDALRLNWYYRPKDIGRKVNDTRQVFASMHSDISPLTALRGKCQIKHKSEVDNLEELRRAKDSFWFEKLYDRYIHRYYEVIPTGQVINVPEEVKKVLDERWKYILVESGRGKELTSAVKSCRKCSRYCASNDSVDCAVCHYTYHMCCVNPPLQKKPSRGFAWACAPCSKAQEKKLEARNTPNINSMVIDGQDEDLNDEDDDFAGVLGDGVDTGRTTPTKTSEADVSIHPATAEQIHQASLWPFRYLGIHCKVEDALDYDDRIYPRASSRLGPRHQAVVPPWPGQPVEYVKAVEVKKKYAKGGTYKKGTKLSEETIAALEADKIARENRPKWVMDEPVGYVHRGEDHDNDDPNNTAKLLFKLPEVGEASTEPERGTASSGSEHLDDSNREQIIDDYMARAKKLAKPLGVSELSTNLMTVAIELLHHHGFDAEKALAALSLMDKKALKEPDLSPAELKKFEDGVAKYGSEWHSIKKHVKTLSAANVVRFYYTWKKTDRGKQVWGNYSGRKGKKEAKKAESNATGKLQDDVADDHDDSAFDNDKAFAKKRGFQCKFCMTRTSRVWRRAPNTPAGTTVLENPGIKASSKDKGSHLTVALCRRCAELWRRYAIQWEDHEEAAKKVAANGGRAWKRKIDEEVLKELIAANEVTNHPPNMPMPPMPMDGMPMHHLQHQPPGPEPPRKKAKGGAEREVSEHTMMDSPGPVATGKKKAASEKPYVPPPPPPPPEPPKARILPCQICLESDPTDQLLSCKDCRMSVHKPCYGVIDELRSDGKWICAPCANDRNPQVSVQYKCMLCPVEFIEQDFVEPPKPLHKKKTEKDRERERIEREKAEKDAEFFKKKQEEANKPTNPREPLKRTANNNWVHVTCAVFTPEVKFGNAKALEPAEGIPSIASARYDEVCKVCKKQGVGACVACHCCRAPVHIECANQSDFLLGFDIVPVKSSRRDQVNIVNMSGEVGTMTAAIWCKEHIPTKTNVYRIYNIDPDTKLSALQLYTQNFKQADLTLTGTVRKATLINQSTKASNLTSHVPPPNRRTSTTTTANGSSAAGRGSLTIVAIKEEDDSGDMSSIAASNVDKKCVTCDVDVTPKWHPYLPTAIEPRGADSVPVTNEVNGDLQSRSDESPLSNGYSVAENGGHVALAAAALHQNTQLPAQRISEFQCHKCHIKKLRREPTPAAPTPEPAPAPAPVAVPSPDVPQPPVPTTPSTINASASMSDTSQPVSQFQWPAPPAYTTAYAPNTSYGDWPSHANSSRQSPAPQSISVNYLNGNPSPSVASGPQAHQLHGPSQIRQHQVPHSPHAAQVQPAQQMNGSSQMRQPPPVPHSPHQNGHMHSSSNSLLLSPHRGMASTAIHLASGAFGSHPSTRPQYLTNGGPPPRANEHPFSQPNGPVHSRPGFGPSHGSPPILRDQQAQGRDLGNAQNNSGRPHDGRVNGGASASPSLRNLLS